MFLYVFHFRFEYITFSIEGYGNEKLNETHKKYRKKLEIDHVVSCKNKSRGSFDFYVS